MDLHKLIRLLSLATLLVCGLCILCCKPAAKDQKLIIAAASNTQYAIKEIIHEFEEVHNIDCKLVLSSSGKLTAQIMEGAPYDVFLSADEKYPNTLFENELTIGHPKVYAEGKLVLWTTISAVEVNLESLLDDGVSHIAIANPKTAPYGRAAKEVLEDVGIYDKVEHKLVYGESISQANRFVTSGAADIGFTAKSVMLGADFREEVNWIEIPTTMYSPLSQAAALIKRKSDTPDQAKLFYEFLFTKEAKMVLKDLGYSVSE